MCPVRRACPLLRAQVTRPHYGTQEQSQPARIPIMNFLIVEGKSHKSAVGGKSAENTRPIYYIKDVPCPAPRSPGGANRPTYSVVVLLEDFLIVDIEHLFW